MFTLMFIFSLSAEILSQETVNFETIAPGTKFGQSINSPGDIYESVLNNSGLGSISGHLVPLK